MPWGRGLLGDQVGVGSAIDGNQLDGPAEQATERIDLLHGEDRFVERRPSPRGLRPEDSEGFSTIELQRLKRYESRSRSDTRQLGHLVP